MIKKKYPSKKNFQNPHKKIQSSHITPPLFVLLIILSKYHPPPIPKNISASPSFNNTPIRRTLPRKNVSPKPQEGSEPTETRRVHPLKLNHLKVSDVRTKNRVSPLPSFSTLLFTFHSHSHCVHPTRETMPAHLLFFFHHGGRAHLGRSACGQPRTRAAGNSCTLEGRGRGLLPPSRISRSVARANKFLELGSTRSKSERKPPVHAAPRFLHATSTRFN